LNLEARQVGERNSLLGRFLRRAEGRDRESVWPSLVADACRGRPSQCSLLLAHWALLAPDSAERREALNGYRSNPELAPGLRPDVLDSMKELIEGDGAGSGPVAYLRVVAMSELFARTYSHALPYSPTALEALWASCEDGGRSEGQCQERRRLLEKLLGPRR
jgi:hypothetical protein